MQVDRDRAVDEHRRSIPTSRHCSARLRRSRFRASRSTGPIGAARVGYKDGKYILNPTSTELETVEARPRRCRHQDAVLMVESEADRLPEDVMLGAVMFGHEQMQAAIEAIRSLAEEAGQSAIGLDGAGEDKALATGIAQVRPGRSPKPTRIAEKQVRYAKIGELKKQCVAELHGRVEATLDAGADRRGVP